jgi:formylglycine-generating enzyme required for sulfatase activity
MMAFDLKIWKQAVGERLKDWKPRFENAGINSLYGFIAASAFMPVIQAASSGDWSAIGLASTWLIGNVGTSLIANMLQDMKDERDAAQKLAQAAEMDSRVRDEVDAVLNALEVFKMAEMELSEDDRTWFAETIEKELAEIGSSVSINVGERGIFIGGDVSGGSQVGTGDYARFIKAEQYYESPPLATDKEIDETADAEERYLKKLYKQSQLLPLIQLGKDPGVSGDVSLDQVYIALNTTHPDENKIKDQEAMRGDEFISALDAAKDNPYLVLLGDPGSGKSTFVRQLAAKQADALLHQNEFEGFSPELVPVLIPLRNIVIRLEKLDLESLPLEKQQMALANFLLTHLEADLSQVYKSPEYFKKLQDKIEEGSCLLVLDGLDEVPEWMREHVVPFVHAIIREFEIERIIVTCRVRSYAGEARLPDFETFTLAPFHREQITDFIKGWYNAQVALEVYTREEADERIDDLSGEAMGEALFELASNPMMLTTMTIIHQKQTTLPRERVRLYKLAVEVLINRWQKGKTGGKEITGDAELDELLFDLRRMRLILERLAYEAHQVEKGESADLSRTKALGILEQEGYLGEIGLASRFLDYVDQRSGLLVGQGGELGKPLTYSFPHRTFQEYLAGCYLVSLRDKTREIYKLANEPEFWNLAVELGAEELYFNGTSGGEHALLDLSYQLYPPKIETDQDCRAALWSAKMVAITGKDAVIKDTSAQGGEEFIQKQQGELTRLIRSDLTAPERAEAGRVLAKLGDPRKEVMDVDWMPFCYVPAGEFVMGERKDEHSVEIDEFYISKYPVSNAQYRHFIDVGGYQNEGLWKEAIKNELWQDGLISRWREEGADQPYNFGQPYNLDNHPVIGIGWYEMLAFTNWLDAKWRAEKMLPRGWRVNLPSEAEWEKSARGGKQLPKQNLLTYANQGFPSKKIEMKDNPEPKRIYPWRGDITTDHLNFYETGIKSTNALGCFPAGASPYGVEELSGNVWEWTRSIHGSLPYPQKQEEQQEREDLSAGVNVKRVLRGGSFFDGSQYVRCAFRNYFFPVIRNFNFGFRVVVCPSSTP